MPLPIETPGPKASSLIKRFQQTIDNADQNAPPPLPKQRLSQGEDSTWNRRSWAVASGGAPLPQHAVAWQPPKNLPNPSISSPGPTSSPRLSATTPELHGSPAPLDAESLPIQNSGSDPSAPSSDIPISNLPASPPLLVSPPRQDHKEPDPKALSPPPTSPLPAAEFQKSGSSSGASKSSTSLASTEPKPRATVSAEATLPPRARKTTNITAPTAASLAKIRSSDSSTPSAGSGTRNVSTPVLSTSSKLPKASPETTLVKKASTGARAVAARAARASTSPTGARTTKIAPAAPQLAPDPPKPRPRSGSLVSSTSTRPLQRKVSAAAKTKSAAVPPFGAGPGLRAQSKSPGPAKAARRVLSPSPQPSARATKAAAGTAVAATGSPKTDTKRPLQRSRVASVATPISAAKKPAAGQPGLAKTAVPAKPGSVGKPGSKTKSGIPMATGSPGRKVSKASVPLPSTGLQGEAGKPVEAGFGGSGGDANVGDTAAATKAEVAQEIDEAGGTETVVTDDEASVKGTLASLARKEDDDHSRVENDAATTNTDGEEEEGPVALSAQEVSEMLTMIEQDQEREIASRSVPSSVGGPEARASLGGFAQGGDADGAAREVERPVPVVVVEHTGLEETESAPLALVTETTTRPAIPESDALAPSHDSETAAAAQVVLEDSESVADESHLALHAPEFAAAQVALEDARAAEPDSASAAAVVAKHDTRVAEPESAIAGPSVPDDTRIADKSESAAATSGLGKDELALTPAHALENMAGQMVSGGTNVADKDELAPIGESAAAQVVLAGASVPEPVPAAADPSLETVAPLVVIESKSITDDKPAPAHGLGSAVTQEDLESTSPAEPAVADPTLESAARPVASTKDSSTSDPDQVLTPENVPGQARPPSISKQAKRRSGIAAW